MADVELKWGLIVKDSEARACERICILLWQFAKAVFHIALR
ncbi:hypothetical protein [Mucilaginibacter paludis]|nr:hypothetical protein [Mucilaginibacter paludis]